MAAAPESLTEQHKHPFATSRNSSVSADPSEETSIFRPTWMVSPELSAVSSKQTFNVRSITKFVHYNGNPIAMLFREYISVCSKISDRSHEVLNAYVLK